MVERRSEASRVVGSIPTTGTNCLRGLADGLYRVETPSLCAEFEIWHGALLSCAPILRRKLCDWAKVAKWIGPLR
jgi:hypothetical protein